jgi:PAS domain S-box-containing protein
MAAKNPRKAHARRTKRRRAPSPGGATRAKAPPRAGPAGGARTELAAVFDALPWPAMVFDAAGRVVRVNAAAVATFGLDSTRLEAAEWVRVATELLGMRSQDGLRVEADDLPVRRALRGEVVRALTLTLRDARGDDVTFEASAIPLRTGGASAGAVVTWHDVTERARAEGALARGAEQLRQNEATLRAILDATKESMWLFGPDGVVRMANQTALRRLGKPAREVVGRHFGELVPPHLVAPRQARIDQVVRSGQPVEFEDERNGMKFVHDFYPVLDAAGGVTHVAAFSRDVTERRRAEEALRASEEKFRGVFDSTGTAFQIGELVRDRDGKPVDVVLLDVNPAFERHAGVPREQAVGRRLTEVFPVVRQSSLDRYGELLRTGGQMHFEEFDAALGRWFDVYASPLTGDRFVAAFTDITPRKELEEDLRSANFQLSQIDRRKNEFLAVLSHELRNPLTPIRNSLFILDRSAPGGEQAQRAKAILERQVAQLTRLVDDLLDVTRITRGRIQVQLGRCDLADLARRTAEDHRAAFVAAGVELELRVPEKPLWVNGDAARLAQAIGNVLRNAARFTRAGGRAVLALEEDEGRRQAVFRVRDTGAGIAADVLARLFQPFAQADQALDRRRGGLGLGLALAKGLVELHAGTIEARSDGPGKGAEFTLRLPLDTREALASATPPPVPHVAPRRVLVIEDNVDAAQSLREALALDAHQVEVAHSGPDGLGKAREFRPDVVVCDVGLPGMDGYEVARAFRADADLRAVRLVALTGYALPDDVAKAREAGFDAHVAKPPTIEKLQRAMDVLDAPA